MSHLIYNKNCKTLINNILAFLFLLNINTCFSQTNTEITKPKIGLVLSGGGAKGLAHIGVLKVIDSLGIKIDYIAGTSMGAIVGGLYASGYTGKQLDSLYKSLDIEALVQDNIPRKIKILTSKRNDDIYALTLPIKNFKIETPNAFSKGIYNFNFLSQATYHVRDIRDFKKLPIPFFCMATNLETGESVVLDKGILPLSIMASGAIPSLYYPVEIDGKLYIDGGVTNNFPVELLKEKGVDIIIGVDVQDNLKDRKNIQGLTTLITQISNFNTQRDIKNKIAKTDIYIRPDITGYNVLSFEDGSKIIKNGENVAQSVLCDYPNLTNPEFIKQKLNLAKDTLYVGNIAFSDLKKYTRAYLLGKLKVKQNGITTFKKFNEGIQNLNLTQNFSSVKYQFNEKDIFISLRENKTTTFLKLAIHYDNLMKSGLLLNFTNHKLISKNDNLSLDFIFGDNFRYDFNYLIDNGYYWSFGVSSVFNRFIKNTTEAFGIREIVTPYNVENINLDFQNFVNKAYLQTILLRKFNFGAGIEHQRLILKSPTLPKSVRYIENSNFLSLISFLNYDTFDNKYFPRKGIYFKGNINYYFHSSNENEFFENYSIAKADIGFAFPIFKKFSILFQNEGGFKVGHTNTPYFDFVLGGYGFKDINNIRPFYGYDFLSLNGDSYVKNCTTLDFEFYKKNHLNFSYNATNIGSFIFNSTKTWLTKPSYFGYGLGYGLETIIGPVEIKYTWNPETRFDGLWFNIGFVF